MDLERELSSLGDQIEALEKEIAQIPKEIYETTLHPKECFGEKAILKHTTRAATCIARTFVICGVVGRDLYRNLLQR